MKVKQISALILTMFLMGTGVQVMGSPSSCSSNSAHFWSFAQITDLHYDNWTSWRTENLQNAINLINSHKDEYNIKFVIISGDLVDSPSKARYDSLKNWILTDLKVPYKSVQGNHDSNDTMWIECFNESTGNSTYYSWTCGGHKFIAVGQNANDDSLTKTELEFLETELQSGENAFVIFHIPIVALNDPNHVLGNKDTVTNILKNYHNLVAVLAGHTHETTYARIHDFTQFISDDIGKFPSSRGAVSIFRVYSNHSYYVESWSASDEDGDFFPLKQDEHEIRELFTATDLRLGVISDTHFRYEPDDTHNLQLEAYFKTILPDLDDTDVDFLINIGDVCDTVSGRWLEQIDVAQTIMYEGTARLILMTEGNHDFFGKWPQTLGGGGLMWDVFDEKDLQTRTQMLGYAKVPEFYAIKMKGINFVALPSIEDVGYGYDRFDEEWLERKLQEDQDTTILFRHEYFGRLSNLAQSVRNHNQVIALVYGHSHTGHIPFLIDGTSCYSFSSARPGFSVDEYYGTSGENALNRYLILSLRADGMYWFERDADDNISILCWHRHTATTFDPNAKTELDLVYPTTDNMVNPLPSVRVTDAKVRVWGWNISEIIPDPLYEYSNSTWEPLNGFSLNTTHKPNTPYTSVTFWNETCTSTEPYARIKIFEKQNLTGKPQRFHIAEKSFYLIGSSTNFKYRATLVNASSGSILGTPYDFDGANNYESWLSFYIYPYNGRWVFSPFNTRSEPFVNLDNVTLQMDYWKMENKSSEVKVAGRLFAWNTSSFCTKVTNGTHSSESIVMAIGNSTCLIFGDLRNFESKEEDIGNIQGGLLYARIGGSKRAFVELKGTLLSHISQILNVCQVNAKSISDIFFRVRMNVTSLFDLLLPLEEMDAPRRLTAFKGFLVCSFVLAWTRQKKQKHKRK